MAVTDHEIPPRESRLVDAVRAYLADPSEENRWQVVSAMTNPTSRDLPEATDLANLINEIFTGSRHDPDVVNDVAFLELRLRPTGEPRAASNGQAHANGAAIPAAVDGDEQFDSDVAWQVRRMAVLDAARALYNAQRSSVTKPERVDVASVVRGDVAPLLPTMCTRTDGQSLIYPGLLHWMYGPAGLGKTMVSMFIAAQLLKAGGTVGYMDWEGNHHVVGDRLRCLGVDAGSVEERFHYYRPGNLEPHSEWLAHVAQPWHLCVFDGTARALAAAGRDEERNPEVLAWMEATLTPITDAGCAVLMLDHVTKDPDSRTMARGAGAKMGEVSGAAWELKAGHPFNRRTAGFVRLIQRKDREGRTGIDGEPVAELHVAPRAHGTTHAELRAPQASAADQARMVAMERVWKAVDSVVKTGQAATTNAVHRIIGGDKSRVAALLGELHDLGHVELERGGGGRSNTWTATTPFMAPAVEPPPSPLTLPNEEWKV